MSIRAGAVVVLSIAGLFSAAGCLSPRAVNLEGRSCPCANGWTCDPATTICVPQTSGVTLDGGIPTDTGGGGDTGGDTGVAGDTMPMTDSAPMDTMMMPGSVMLWYEAEDGTLEAPMASATGDALASGMAYVSTEGVSSTAMAPATGKVTFDVDAPAAGTYRIWGRVFTPDLAMDVASHDSFWVRVNGGAWEQYNSIGPFSMDYGWDDFHGMDGMSLDFTLNMGANTVDVAYREMGARLDKILVTDDLMFTPTGMGG